MRVALISDIHGDLVSLEAVVYDLLAPYHLLIRCALFALTDLGSRPV